MRIYWKVNKQSTNIASVRYRALIPIYSLKNFQSKIGDNPSLKNLKEADVLVIIKSFTLLDVHLAQKMEKLNKKVIFDLCDNIFFEGYGGTEQDNIIKNFYLISNTLSAITVPTSALRDVVLLNLPRKVPVFVIPDGFFSDEIKNNISFLNFKFRYQRLISFFSLYNQKKIFYKIYILLTKKITSILYRIKNILKRNLLKVLPAIRRNLLKVLPVIYSKKELDKKNKTYNVLWFGNHGEKYADFGMTDLLIIARELVSISNNFPIKLIVVSNSYFKYQKIILPLNIKSEYIEWSIKSLDEALSKTDIVLLPNSLDDFSRCKSSNRTVTALSKGVPVVATKTPDLNIFSECVLFDDFEAGIKAYLTDNDLRQKHLANAQEVIKEFFSKPSTSRQWMRLLEMPIHKKGSLNADIGVVVFLPQDIVYLDSIIYEAQKKSLSLIIYTSLTSLYKWHQLRDFLVSKDLNLSILDDRFGIYNMEVLMSENLKGFISIAETNLSAHKFSNFLAKIANKKNIPTYTMQHGYENVGLTYTDPIHNASKIEIASKQIFIWGDASSLVENINPKVRSKIISLGLTKKIKRNVQKNDTSADFSPNIIIFENLHWHRYSEDYKKSFLINTYKLIKHFPDLNFIIKPHDAGLWLIRNQNLIRPPKNLKIIDPSRKNESDLNIDSLFAKAFCVITSPSTVALDASLLEIPTAVVDFDLGLDNYDPLSLLHTFDDWVLFVNNCLSDFKRKKLKKLAREFISNSIVSKDGLSKMFDHILFKGKRL